MYQNQNILEMNQFQSYRKDTPNTDTFKSREYIFNNNLLFPSVSMLFSFLILHIIDYTFPLLFNIT